MDSSLCLCLLVGLCLIYSGSCRGASKFELHEHLRRALPRAQYALCLDKPECQTQPGICTVDQDLALVLCPSKCGGCVCEDNAVTEGTCPQLVPDVCEGELAVSLCPQTCGLCDQSAPTCFDHVIGLSCDELPDPCNDPLGMIACPKFCGMCKNDTTTMPTTMTTTPMKTTPTTTTPKPTTTTTQAPLPTTPANPGQGACAQAPCLNNGVCVIESTALGYRCDCPTGFEGFICQTKLTTTAATAATTTTTANPNSNSGSCDTETSKLNISCVPSEVVFMIEYAGSDAYGNGVDHECDFVRELVDAWELKARGVRFGVIIYHDTVREAIHIDDFENNPQGLKDRLNRLSRDLKPSGNADLGKALDYARTKAFVGARPNAEKILIPIVHNMNRDTKGRIVPAAQRLKDDCVVIVGLAIYSRTIDYDIMHKFVTQPYNSYYQFYNSHNSLEEAGKYTNQNGAPCN